MSKVLITSSKLDHLANTISAKSGAALPLTIAEMDAAVESISGGSVTVEALNVTQNGTYIAQSGKAYSPVTVAVPSGADTSQDTVDAAHLYSGYTAHDSTGAQIVGSYNPPTFTTQTKSATPTTSQQTITPDSGYDGLSSVTVSAMPTGTAGTPTASKSTVSNHAISVTPSVTNATGYITGSTKTGTAVSVSASELVSGSQTLTSNDTYDVTNLASVVVNVSGSGGSSWELIKSQTLTGVTQTSTSAQSAGTIALGSAAATKDAIIWVHIRDTAGPRAGYFYGSDAIFVNALKANGSTSAFTGPGVETIRYSTSSQFAGYTGAYGVYGYSIANNGTLTVRKRYNSTYSLTINGDYKVDVYKLTPPSGMVLFE